MATRKGRRPKASGLRPEHESPTTPAGVQRPLACGHRPFLERPFTPVDPAALAVFRIALGTLLVVLVARYFAYGWIDAQFTEPSRFFTWGGFEWVRPWAYPGMHVHFASLGILAACITVGLFTRPAALLFFLGFTYVHLIDKANYLNHYYLISLLTGLMVFLPVNACASLDARLGFVRPRAVPAWTLWLLRFQVGVVYLFAGVAKLQADWLLRAQPLRLWLSHCTDLPVIGPMLGEVWAAYLFSWASAAFDLAIPFLLLIRKFRPWAFASAVVFHVLTAVLFPIGLFPWIMIVCALVFFRPDWPRRFLPGRRHPKETSTVLVRPGVVVLLGVYALLQIAIPLRCWLYPGDVHWTEEGFRFSWRVMVAEKTAHARFRVLNADTGERFDVAPRDYLTPVQAHYMSGQPDMIRDFAVMIRREYEIKRGGRIEVRADVRAAVNGRPSRRLVDPETDLSRVGGGWVAAPWILSRDGPRDVRVAGKRDESRKSEGKGR